MLPTIIRTTKDFKMLVDRVLTTKCVAIDTEFIWERTYYPILGIVQIGISDKECFLIDVAAVRNVYALGKILTEPRVVKILHDAHQDLTILYHATGTFPKNIFDTQRAAGFIGKSCTISLGQLLYHMLGVKLSKTETRTNWLKRPLSKRQVAYALDDVRYLPSVRDVILSRVRKNGFEAWLNEELKEYDNPELYKEKDSHILFQRIKGTKRFTPEELAVLYELVIWREKRARSQDRPREHIVSDKTLVSITQYKPETVAEIKPSRGFPAKKIQLYGSEIIGAVAKGVATPPDKCPQSYKPVEDDEALNARIDFTMASIKGQCISHGIDPALIASRSEIIEFVRNCFTHAPGDHRLLKGWRKTFLGDKLKRLLSGQHAIWLDPSTGLPQITPFPGDNK